MPTVNAVLYGADDVVGAHVRSRLLQGIEPGFELPGPAADGSRLFYALGVTRPGSNGDRQLLGGVVYYNLRKSAGKNVCIEAGFAFDRANWASRDALWQLFAYPFEQPPVGLGCATMVVQVRRSNRRSRGIVERLGFKLVGPIPRAFDGREDICLYAMTKDKCRWLKEKSNV